MEEARIKKLPFRAILERLELLHGIEIQEHDAINLGLLAWDDIGNKETINYRLSTTIADKRVTLPCNVEYIEAVTLKVGDDCDLQIGELDTISEFIFNRDSREDWVHDLYPNGQFLKYRLKDGYLEFDVDGYDIEVLYVGIRADKEGLPYLNEKEARAITYYIAYNHYYKQFAIGANPRAGDLMNIAERQWNQLCPDARVPYEFTQNELDRVLDAQQSWNWKAYGKSFKITR